LPPPDRLLDNHTDYGWLVYGTITKMQFASAMSSIELVIDHCKVRASPATVGACIWRRSIYCFPVPAEILGNIIVFIGAADEIYTHLLFGYADSLSATAKALIPAASMNLPPFFIKGCSLSLL
jgi:hypothetical protein